MKAYPILIEQAPPALVKAGGFLLSFAGDVPYLVPDLMTATSLIITYPEWVGRPDAPMQSPQGFLQGNQQGSSKEPLTHPPRRPKGKERN